MKILPAIFVLAAALVAAPLAARAEAPVPQSVAELWADFDPRKDPLETEIVREWKAGGIVLRVVRFSSKADPRGSRHSTVSRKPRPAGSRRSCTSTAAARGHLSMR